ncbi:MAG TPA: hypothetical protein VFT62_05330 [Mycobacteriales bacterium]|nr:hypothetical protein [Mycobacteriales bacterium]
MERSQERGDAAVTLALASSLDAVDVEVAMDALAPDLPAVRLELRQREITDKSSVFLTADEAARLGSVLLRLASAGGVVVPDAR